MEGYLFIYLFIHLDGTVAWRERALGLFLRLFYLVTVQLQQSHGVIAVPLSQLCSSPLLGKDDGSCFPRLLTGSCGAQAGFQQVTDPESPALPSPCQKTSIKNSRNGESKWGELMQHSTSNCPIFILRRGAGVFSL